MRLIHFRPCLVTLGLTLLGCGDNGGVTCPDGQPVSIRVLHDVAQPVYLRFRADNEDWIEPQLIREQPGGQEYQACSVQSFSVFSACRVAQQAVTETRVVQSNRTTDGSRELTVLCAYLLPEADGPTVSGSMREPGRIAIGPHSQRGVTPDWDFALSVAEGTYDVVANSDTHIWIQREHALGLVVAA